MSNKIVVTRHPALVEYLKELGVVKPDEEIEVLTHVSTPEQVRGKHVIGVLPLHLAALAEKITVVSINIPPELRGKELSIHELRMYSTGVKTYRVVEVE